MSILSEKLQSLKTQVYFSKADNDLDRSILLWHGRTYRHPNRLVRGISIICIDDRINDVEIAWLGLD